MEKSPERKPVLIIEEPVNPLILKACRKRQVGLAYNLGLFPIFKNMLLVTTSHRSLLWK